jgi:predicted ATPase/class 3 adenylate cyclase/DNA-binding CsgD family transcriptional regulator
MERRELPTGTVTFLFSDMEGSTRLVADLGPAAFTDILDRHNRVLRAAFAAHGGVERGTQGDSFLVMFREAPAALAAAAQAQRGLTGTDWPGSADVRVRMGIHTGVATLGGDDYVGLDVNRAARISAAAHGGQVLLSDATRALVDKALPMGLSIRNLGKHTLRDLGYPEQIFQLVVDGLPAEFPPVRTLESASRKLPQQLTSFVGRERDVDRIKSLLADTRLLTLTGPGGIGKTRLAIEAARRSSRRFVGGIFFVELAGLRAPELLLATIGGALGIEDLAGASAIEALSERLGSSETLLVLDNFEQITSAGPALSELLAASPTLRVAVTSRAPLHLAGEQEYPVAPLELADPDPTISVDQLRAIGSVALFVERARAVRPDFVLTESNVQAISKICRRLDGLPLAIELAAARSKVISAEMLLRRLENRLPALAIGPADAPARQRTVQATISWSYDLLGSSERRTFARLGIFVGGFSLAAAAEMLHPTPDRPKADVLEPLSNLVDQSLLHVEQDVEGEPRFRMLEPIREFALDQLSAAEVGELRDRHLAHFIRVADSEQAHERGADQGAWIHRLAADRDNIRAALAHALDQGNGEGLLRLAGALERRFWLVSGDLNLAESRRWLDAGLAMGPAVPAAVRARALLRLAETHALSAARIFSVLEEALAEYSQAGDQAGITEALAALGSMAIYGGDLAAANAHLTRGLTLARSIHARPERLVELLVSLGLLGYRLRKPGLGRAHFEEALVIARQAGDASGMAKALGHLGRLAMAEGASASAQASLAENVELARTIGDTELLGMALCDLASARIASGQLDATRPLILEAAHATRRLNWWYLVRVLDAVAQWLFAVGAVDEAVKCLSAADRSRQDTEMSWDPDRVATRDGLIERARKVLHRSAFGAAWATGQTLSLDAVLERGLMSMETTLVQSDSTAARGSRGRRDLSPRELEVIALVADGRSDGEIAAELVISKKTASAHVAHIKNKLGVESRVEIATAAIRGGLVEPFIVERR